MFFRAVKFVRKDLEFLLQEKVLLFFALKSLSGETLCKFAQIFPPKDLVYFWKIFLDTFLINKTLLIALCCNNSKSKKENEIKDFFILLFLIVVVKVNKLLFLKKKIRRMRRGRAVFF